MTSAARKPFHLGLAMSGAISAGAYTAGVFDFLIEALDEWEKALAANGATVPNHLVGLKAMSGASAGAITAAIGALALVDDAQAPGVYTAPKTGASFPYCLPKLYHSWVVTPTLVAETAGDSDMLKLGDLDDPVDPQAFPYNFSHTTAAALPQVGAPAPVASLLNVRLLAEIARDALVVQPKATPRAYIAQPLHVYMTLTNLRGVPYKVGFDGGDYFMITHGDRVHYAVNGAGGWTGADALSKFGDDDAPRKIQASSLTTALDKQPDDWRDFAICALASSAFPVGLSPRVIGGDPVADYKDRLFPSNELVTDCKGVEPNWTDSVLAEKTHYAFTTADGGIIDNDPFEYAHFAIKEAGKLNLPVPAKLAEVERAVIMISPFPEEKPIRSAGDPELGIVGVLSALFPSLIDQARFKPEALALAANEQHASRYLIGPSRVTKDAAGNEKLERYGIASGLLGGFGGFVARAFRDHDFQLGRRNCQRFLQTTFALPADNPVINSWGPGVDKSKFEAIDETKRKPKSYCLVPLYGSAHDEAKLPAWPRLSQAEFDTLQQRIADRFDYVAPKLLDENVKGFLGFLVGLVLLPGVKSLPGLIRSRALDYIRLLILADLVRRDQIAEWDLPAGLDLAPDDARLVLGELLNPSYDQRNVAGIFKAVGATSNGALNEATIQALLDRLKSTPGKFQVWEAPWRDKAGGRLFTLDSRKPNLFENIFGGRLGWVLKPTVDAPGV